MSTEVQAGQQPPTTNKTTAYEDEICHIGLIHPTLLSIYPDSAKTLLDSFKAAYLGKRLSAKDGRTWAIVEIFISSVHSDRVMARLRRVDGK